MNTSVHAYHDSNWLLQLRPTTIMLHAYAYMVLSLVQSWNLLLLHMLMALLPYMIGIFQSFTGTQEEMYSHPTPPHRFKSPWRLCIKEVIFQLIIMYLSTSNLSEPELLIKCNLSLQITLKWIQLIQLCLSCTCSYNYVYHSNSIIPINVFFFYTGHLDAWDCF